MTRPLTHIIISASVALVLVMSPLPVAADLITYSVPTDYATIQSAIDAADNLLSQTTNTHNFEILVEPGIYAGPITLKRNITLRGRETFSTVLSGGGSGAIIIASGAGSSAVNGAGIRNFTFRNASTAIAVSGNAMVYITNNVFFPGTGGVGVQLAGSQGSEIINNTFYLNGTAIIRDNDTNKITNNLFSNNTTNISQTSIPDTRITYNAFNPAPSSAEVKGSFYIPNPLTNPSDPLFVDAANLDFHLKSGPSGTSPCIDSGDPNILDPFLVPPQTSANPSDIGAYGGPKTDTIPRTVRNVLTTATTATPYSITISWAADQNYLVKGYKVHYGYAPKSYSGNDAIVSGGTATVLSPIDAGAATSETLFVSPTSTTPPAPALNDPSPFNGGLVLTWSAADGATSYNIHYSLNSAPTSTITISVGNVTTHKLTGLMNGERYTIAVSAVSQMKYFIAVTAYDMTGPGGTSPGVAHESSYSIEREVPVGPASESGPSNSVQGLPEMLVPYPNLPNTGCFIATAAYGSQNSSSVRLLREFRDTRLLTNAPGRAFVRWYYEHSPAAALFLNERPALKPFVRAALAPAVAVAFLLTETSPAVTASALLLMLTLTIFLLRRKQRTVPRTLSRSDTPQL